MLLLLLLRSAGPAHGHEMYTIYILETIKREIGIRETINTNMYNSITNYIMLTNWVMYRILMME